MKRNSLHWCLFFCMALFLCVGLFSLYNAYDGYMAVLRGQENMESYLIQQDMEATTAVTGAKDGQARKAKNLQQLAMTKEDRNTLEYLQKYRHHAEWAIWIQLILVSLGLFGCIKAFHLLDELYTIPLTSLSTALSHALQVEAKGQWIPPCRLPLLNRISTRCNQLIEMRQRQEEGDRLALLEMRESLQMLLNSFDMPIFLMETDGRIVLYNRQAESLVAQEGFSAAMKKAHEEHLPIYQAGTRRFSLQEKTLKGMGGYQYILLQIKEEV